MATRSQVRVFVRDRGLITLNSPGPHGDVWKYTNRLANQVEFLASRLAPKRTHRLANTMRVSVTPLGTRGVQGNVRALAPYALYVHEGTTGPIYPRNSRLLTLGPYPPKGYFRATAHESVSGQRPQPFLANALRIIMRAQ